MSGWMPSTSQVRADFGELAEGTSERRLAGFDRWLASVERAAAERAWGEGTRAQWRLGQVRDVTQIPDNPYRREETE